jgi:hypothetical protein
MEITVITIDRFSPIDKGCHILTYAEEGFSPLSIYSQSYNLDATVIKEFAEAVNQRDESGSLLPGAPISAIPRRLIREYGPEVEPALRDALKDFLKANRQHIHAKKIIIDFGTPHVGGPLFRAVIDFFNTLDCPELEEVLLIDGN